MTCKPGWWSASKFLRESSRWVSGTNGERVGYLDGSFWGNRGTPNGALSHQWRDCRNAVGIAFQSLRSCSIYLDRSVRNNRNGPRSEGNCPHHIGHRGAASDRVYLRPCCSCLGRYVPVATEDTALPALKSKSKLFPIVTGARFPGRDNLRPLNHSWFDFVRTGARARRGANNRQFAVKHVEELRQFINAGLTQNSANSR